MLNIHELEKRHFKYKLKSYTPYIIIFSSLIVITGIMFVFNSMDVTSEDTVKIEQKSIPKQIAETKKEEIVQNTIEIKIETKPEKIEQQNKAIQEEINNTKEVIHESTAIETSNIKENKTEIIEKKLVLAPSMNFMEKIDARPSATSTYVQPVKKEKMVPKEQTKVKVVHIPQKIRQVVTPKEVSSIQIKKNNTYSDIQDVIKRFKKNNNPALSLFIAKKYYELGEYKKSYNYALRTNEINNNIEASWIIFAKSLVKLDKKGMAIKTLKKYISHSDSNKAKILLDEISSGKLNAN